MKKLMSVRKSTRPTFRPRLEPLETRLTPTKYTVSSLADSGNGTLRAAITSVNSDPVGSADVIDFSVAGVIKLTSGALPAVATVDIDGTTAPGFSGAPVVEIDNNGFAGLNLAGSQSTLASLSIVNANGPGVTIQGGQIVSVVGNYIGLALDGAAAPNTGAGSLVTSFAVTIGGTSVSARNIISGNGGNGIQLGSNGSFQQDQRTVIEGNFIGTDMAGQAAVPNGGNGVSVFSTDNTIGGTDAGAANIIAFNKQSGVVLDRGGDNAILNNSIFNNGSQGIEIQNGGNSGITASRLTSAIESPGPTSGSVLVEVGGLINTQGSVFGGDTFTVQVFATLNGVSSGQGQIYLGSVQTTTSNGIAPFTLSNASVPAGTGTTFTATATSIHNTSAFSNSIGIGTANQAYVANVYQLLLGRDPDPSSAVWVNGLNDGASPAAVVLGVEGSPEYLQLQVAAMYGRYLNRLPDTAGAEYWVSFLQAGGTFEEVAAELTASQEFFVNNGATNPGFVIALYTQVLNRSPSNAEIAGWVIALDSGEPRLGISIGFFTCQEYRTNLVEADYLTFLLRPADSGGLAAWVNALNAGATDQQVVAQIFGSAEGYQLWS
jgi:hypothetical protein